MKQRVIEKSDGSIAVMAFAPKARRKVLVTPAVESVEEVRDKDGKITIEAVAAKEATFRDETDQEFSTRVYKKDVLKSPDLVGRLFVDVEASNFPIRSRPVNWDADKFCGVRDAWRMKDGKVVIDKTLADQVEFKILREHRNKLLEETDWTQAGDASLTDTKKQKYKDYRQALRDLPASGPLSTMVFPVQPA
jgi:hypothetical protein